MPSKVANNRQIEPLFSESLKRLYPNNSSVFRLPINPEANPNQLSYPVPQIKISPKKTDKPIKNDKKPVVENDKSARKHHQSQPIPTTRQQANVKDSKAVSKSEQALNTNRSSKNGNNKNPIYLGQNKQKNLKVKFLVQGKPPQKQPQLKQAQKKQQPSPNSLKIHEPVLIYSARSANNTNKQVVKEDQTIIENPRPKFTLYHILNKFPNGEQTPYIPLSKFEDLRSIQEISKSNQVQASKSAKPSKRVEPEDRRRKTQSAVALPKVTKTTDIQREEKKESAPAGPRFPYNPKKRPRKQETTPPQSVQSGSILSDSTQSDGPYQRFKIRKRPPMFLRHYPIMYRNMFRPGKRTDESGKKIETAYETYSN
jgi:hypothetical protein